MESVQLPPVSQISTTKEDETKGDNVIIKKSDDLPFVARNFWIRFTPAAIVWPRT